jgi:hypothetical protein
MKIGNCSLYAQIYNLQNTVFGIGEWQLYRWLGKYMLTGLAH